MRIAHIIDPLIGVTPDVNINEDQYVQWQRDHLAVFGRVCVSVDEGGAGAILITGRLFSDSFVSDAEIARVLDIIRERACPVLWLPDSSGTRCLRRAWELPENLFILDKGDNSVFSLGGVNIIVWTGDIPSHENCTVLVTDEASAESAVSGAAEMFPELRYAVCGNRAFTFDNGRVKTERLAKMENTSFDDTEKSGYYLLETEDGLITGREKIAAEKYGFKTLRIDLETGDDLQSVCEKCSIAAERITQYDLVRIVLCGKADTGSFVRAEHIREIMKECFFYLEVRNDFVLDIKEEAHKGDISLESEFVREVLADDTLTDAEKCRVIECGRGALCGKELSE